MHIYIIICIYVYLSKIVMFQFANCSTTTGSIWGFAGAVGGDALKKILRAFLHIVTTGKIILR